MSNKKTTFTTAQMKKWTTSNKKITFTTARMKKWDNSHRGTVVTRDDNDTRVYVCNVVNSSEDGGNKTVFWEESMKSATGRKNSLKNQICNFFKCGELAKVGGHVRVFKGPKSEMIDGWFIMPTCYSCNNSKLRDCPCDEKHPLSINYKLVFRKLCD